VTFVAWIALVACRVVARLMAVGAGSRGPLGLTLLTASVNAFWLIAGPGLAWLRRFAFARLSRAAAIAAIFVGCVAILLAEPAWYRLVLPWFNGDPTPWREAVIIRADISALIVAVILATGWLRDGFARAVERQRQRRALEAVLVDAELRALALQMQPHFLFNTLQLAAEAAYDDIAEGRRVVGDLTMLLRRTFELEEHSLVRVRDEIDFLESYVAIQQRRFGSRLTVDIHVDADVNDLLIPPLLLQPLVENSIQHGIGPVARDGRIFVRVARGHESLRMDVRDNGVGFAAATRSESRTGLGIGVTRRRLESMFPGVSGITTGDAAGGGAIVSVSLPAIHIGRTPPVGRDEADDDRRFRSGSALAAVGLGVVLVMANVAAAAYLLDKSSPPNDGSPVRNVVWLLPVQMLVFALCVILWRARGVRRWLQRRDAESRALSQRIDEIRGRVASLRSGKDAMISALERLSLARDARDFDELTVGAAEMVRSLLAVDRNPRMNEGRAHFIEA
jgi:two-component system LytT family sensor kinase